MEKSFRDVEESEEAGDLVWDVYMYLMERQYPLLCVELRKRAIRSKAAKFVIHDGKMYLQKQEKARDGTKVWGLLVNWYLSYIYTICVHVCSYR